MLHAKHDVPFSSDLSATGRLLQQSPPALARSTACLVLSILTAVAITADAWAQPGWVLGHQKVSDTRGGFTGTLSDGDGFGGSLVSIGDLDGDGVGDLALGARGDDDGGARRGAVWVLFMNAGGTVKSHQKISATQGGFAGILDDSDYFGTSVASLGDLDGDGIVDLAVGAYLDDDGGRDRGAVWVLFLNRDGAVKNHQKISSDRGGFFGKLYYRDLFGLAVTALGDLDGDGVCDLAVGAPGVDERDGGQGAVWILFLNTNGTVKTHQKISDTEGGFTGGLVGDDAFGLSMASLGDFDGDGLPDLAVGATGGSWPPRVLRGAVWVLLLNSDGTVRFHQKISENEGGFTGTLDNRDRFGSSLVSLGDLDGDGVTDLAVGAQFDDDGGADRGALWVLFLDRDGSVKSHLKMSDTEGGFTGTLDDRDYFGSSLASLGDLDGDGISDLAAGAPGDGDGGPLRGAMWVLFLDDGSCDPCDANCDGDLNVFDIEPFLDLLSGGTRPCDACTGDVNGDGSIDAFDIEPFVACLFR